MMAQDLEIHRPEFKYWSIEDDDNEENWFYVTRFIREITHA